MVRPIILTLLTTLACIYSFPAVLAAPFEESEPQDWKLTGKGTIPDAGVINRFPAYMAANERLLLRVPQEAIAGRAYRIHKKFDSLSGGTFGMQKRYPYPPDSGILYGPMA